MNRLSRRVNKSLLATRDGAFSSASRFTSSGLACLSSGRYAASMRMMKTFLLFGFGIAMLCSGCSSLLTHGLGNGKYPGVRLDAGILSHKEDKDVNVPSGPIYGLLVCYALIDFPFSAVGDTLLLPFDPKSSK